MSKLKSVLNDSEKKENQLIELWAFQMCKIKINMIFLKIFLYLNVHFVGWA